MATTTTGNGGGGGNDGARGPPIRREEEETLTAEERTEAERAEADHVAAENAEAERIEAEHVAAEKLEHQKEVNAKKWTDFETAIKNAIDPTKLAELEKGAEDLVQHPDEKTYKPEVPVEQCAMPHKIKTKGLGINLFKQLPIEDVHVIKTTNDTFQFNEPRNFYGLKVVTEVCARMHSGKTRSEENVFRAVILDEINKYALKGDYPEVKTLQKRPGDFLWYIWKGFNTEGTDGNKLFTPILVHYAQIRLGITPVRSDEVDPTKRIFRRAMHLRL